MDASSRPAECDSFPKCEQVPKILASPGKQASLDLKIAAFRKGYRELESALRAVRRDCEEAYCANFMRLDPGEREYVTVQVSYRFPLAVLLKKHFVTLRTTARQRKERELVDDNLDLDLQHFDPPPTAATPRK